MQYVDNMCNLDNIPPCMMQNQYWRNQPPLVEMIPYMYPLNIPEALSLIWNAVNGEMEDRLFYEYLMENAPSEEDKEIINGIREDEMSHYSLFRQIYYQITGQIIPGSEDTTFEKPASYWEGIKKSILGEQNAVKKYRKILFALQNRVQINALTKIITDEIRHGILYNYLYTKNDCRA